MGDGLLDAVGDVLKPHYLGLPTHVHHPGDCIDGGGERVELLVESYDRQNK